MPFGMSSAPEVFAERFHRALEGLENVESSADDIAIYAATLEELERITQLVI